MKALFITKPFIIEPLGLMYLSAAAKKAGHETDLAITSENLEKKVQESKPDLIGYSVMTGDQDFYLDINNKLKENHQFLSILGGPHPTFFQNLIYEPGVDIVCQGEGEQALVDLLNNLESGKDILDISNLSVKKDGKVRVNEVRALADIDSLPLPDRDIVFQFSEIKNGPIKHFLASRGCPFSCSYCFNESYFKIYQGKGKRVRIRNIDSLIEEIQEVVKSSPTRFIYFQDDTFTLNKNWLKEFSEEYTKKVNMPFHCHVRPNTIDEEKIKILKKAGCYSAHIAAETADDRLRNEILKRGMTKEQILDSAKLLKKYDIKFMLQNMIGLPTGSIEKDFETLELNIQCNPDYAWVSIFQPYPGTAIGEYCKEKGFYTGDFSDLSSNFFDSSRLNFDNEYKNQLSNLQKLFAIFVEYPELHELGLSRTWIDFSNDQVKEEYQKAYTEFRKKGDKRLYGFDL